MRSSGDRTLMGTKYDRHMELKGKTIAIYADIMYQEMELWYPLFRMREAGAQVVVAAAEAGKTYTSKLGYPVKSDQSYEELAPAKFNGVIVPGGFAPDYMRRYPAASTFIQAMDAEGKLV